MIEFLECLGLITCMSICYVGITLGLGGRLSKDEDEDFFLIVTYVIGLILFCIMTMAWFLRVPSPFVPQ